MGKSSITFEDLYHMPVDEIENNGRDSGTFGDGMRSHANKIDKLGGRVPSYYRSVDGQVLEQTLYVEAKPFQRAGGKFDEIGKALNDLAKDLSELKSKAQALAKEVESTPFLEWADRTNGVARVQELTAAQVEQMTPREKQLYQEALSKVGPLNEKMKAAVKAARAVDDAASAKIEGLGPDGADERKPPTDEDERPRGPGDEDTTGSRDTGGNTDGNKTGDKDSDDDRTGNKDGDKDSEDRESGDEPGQRDGETGPEQDGQDRPDQDGGQDPGEEGSGEYPGEDGSTDPDEWNPDDDYEGGGLADGGGVGGGLGAAGGGGVSGGLGGAGGGGVSGGVGAATGGAGGIPMPVGAAGAAGAAGRGIPLGGGMMGAGHGGHGGGEGGGEHTWLSEDDDPFGTGDAAPPVIGYLPPVPAAETEQTTTDRPNGGTVTSFG